MKHLDRANAGCASACLGGPSQRAIESMNTVGCALNPGRLLFPKTHIVLATLLSSTAHVCLRVAQIPTRNILSAGANEERHRSNTCGARYTLTSTTIAVWITQEQQ